MDFLKSRVYSAYFQKKIWKKKEIITVWKLFLGPGSCGTVAPVWLDMRTRQNFTENLYSVDACVSWGFGDGGFDNFDCCLFTLPVKVKQCKGFRVYYLGPTQACDIAYCSAPTFKGSTKGQ